MASPFPGMDPYLEFSPIFHELHTQMLAEAQAQLQPQLRPKYVARLERHLSEGGMWELGIGGLDRKEPDVTLIERDPDHDLQSRAVETAQPTAVGVEELDEEELEMRRQRRIVIYVKSQPRIVVTAIELLSPSNKTDGSLGQARYLEKRTSALHGGIHWIEVDLLRGGARPAAPIEHEAADYQAYIAQATATGWRHQVYSWGLRDKLPTLPIPLLDDDRAALDLSACFTAAYQRIAADDEADYDADPPPPPLSDDDRKWVEKLLVPIRQAAGRTNP